MRKKKMILLLICLLAVAALVFAFVFGARQKAQPEAEEAVPDMVVETPYGALHYPGDWGSRVYAETEDGDGLTVTFYGLTFSDQEVRLFDVLFGDAQADVLGTITLESGEICPVGVHVYDLESQGLSAEKDIYEINAMQEQINYLISRLPVDNAQQFSVPQTSTEVVKNQRPAVYADVQLETPYGTVAYPGELAGVLRVEMENSETYPVTFFWNRGDSPVRLFEIAFGGENGMLMGYLPDSGKPVYVTVFDIAQEENLSQEELDTALRLQEVLNDVLDRLSLQSQGAEEIACLTYDTPYGALCYPDTYQQNLHVEISEALPYTVKFRFLRDNAESFGLFDVVFGGTEGVPVGYYTGEDGVSIAVHLVSYSIPDGILLSQEEQNLYYMMVEDVNVLFEKYEQMHGFVFQ